MKKVGKYIVVSAALAVFIAVFSLLIIAYDRGMFELPFIKRFDTDTTAQTDTEPSTGPDETDPGGETTVPGTDDPATDTVPEQTEPGIFDEIHGKYGKLNGRNVEPTEADYDPDTMTLYRLDTVSLPFKTDKFVYTVRTRWVETKKDNLRVFTETRVPEMRSAVDVYMGMLVLLEDDSLTFYDGRGGLLYKYTGEEDLIFAYDRDSEGRPLFIIGEQYYYIEDGELCESDFDARDSLGLHFNYNADFAKDADQCSVYRSGSKYGILTADGKTLRSAMFKEAYNYSEGLGLVNYPINGRDDYCYLNEAGKVVIENFQPVGAHDEAGIGSIYFDGGYVMTRRIKYHPLKKDVVEEDTDILVDKRGREFDMPEGYTAVCYSDQRIMVKRNNRYGFYAVKGAWVADAVYTYATPFYEGLAVVGDASGKGVIDLDGNFVIPQSYTTITVCSGGIFVCWSNVTGYEVYIKGAA